MSDCYSENDCINQVLAGWEIGENQVVYTQEDTRSQIENAPPPHSSNSTPHIQSESILSSAPATLPENQIHRPDPTFSLAPWLPAFGIYVN